MKKSIYFIYVLALVVILSFATMHVTSKVGYVEDEVLPTPTATPTAVEEGFSPSVCVTKSGTKYHKSDCEWIKDSIVIRYTKNKAISMGYEACNTCKP